MDGQNNRLQGYLPSDDVTSSNCTLNDIKASDEIMPAQASTWISFSINLNSNSTPPVTPFNLADSSSFNYEFSLPFFDKAGEMHSLAIYFVKANMLDTWDAYITVDGVLISDGKIYFNASGSLKEIIGINDISYSPNPGEPKQFLHLNLEELTQNAAKTESTGPVYTNGFMQGDYIEDFVDSAGYVFAYYTNNQTISYGKIAVVHDLLK